MTIAVQIYELVKQLPEDKAAEVLAFATSIKAQQESAASEKKRAGWRRLLDSIDSADWEDFPSLKEIRAGEGKDAPREIW